MDEQQHGRFVVALDPTPEQRVARGVALLDERVPDWRTRIDVDRLDMNDGTACVVGQVTRSVDPDVGYPWHTGLNRLELSSYDAHDHGFITENKRGFIDHDATEALRDLWIKAITGE